jgi:hypothetical protein
MARNASTITSVTESRMSVMTRATPRFLFLTQSFAQKNPIWNFFAFFAFFAALR